MIYYKNNTNIKYTILKNTISSQNYVWWHNEAIYLLKLQE